jgi:glycosyltransferase involved in cell wall biosynthesis
MTGPDTVNATSPFPLVSVIINCYNGERFVREAIDSVYAQSWPSWEIVFWDNASTDGTGEIARSYDQRLRYFRAEHNTPLGQARNLAFAQARGVFVAMLDSDDVWLPDTLQKLVTGIDDDEGEYAVCYGGVYRIDAEGREIGRMVPKARRGNLLADFLRQFDIMPCAAIIRRAVLVDSGHEFDVSLTTSEDVCFFMTLAADRPFRSLAECVARYRIHEGALTNRSIARWADEWEYTLEQIKAAHPGIDRVHRSGFRHLSARIDYYRARNLMRQGDRAGARGLLCRNVTVDLRYLVLFLVSLLPSSAWNLVHTWYHRRSQFS